MSDYHTFRSSLSTGEVAGIVIGSIAGAAVIIVFIVCVCNITKRSKADSGHTQPNVFGVSNGQTGNVNCSEEGYANYTFQINLPLPPINNAHRSDVEYVNCAFRNDSTSPTYSTDSNTDMPPSYNEVMNNDDGLILSPRRAI